MPVKAWTFYRRSTNLQELSVDDQRRECRAFAEAKQWEIVREFIPEKGYASGLTIDRDPAFQDMVRTAQRGNHGVSHLIVYDVSRLGRLPAKRKIYYEQLFEMAGILVIYVRGGFRNDGTIGDDLTQFVMHSEANQYSVKLSEVTLRGMKHHAELGHSVGGKAPYGYDRLLIDQAGKPVKVLRLGEHKADKLQRVIFAPSAIEAPVVREIFEAYANGKGLFAICNSLNERKVPAPRGRFWSKTILHYMLRNRAYLGERIYNRRSYKAYRRGEKGQLPNPKADWIVAHGAHPPIIEPELFDRVRQQVRTVNPARSRGGRTTGSPYLLTGISVCAKCGYKMIGRPENKKGKLRAAYVCSGYNRMGSTVCNSVHIPLDAIEGGVLNTIRDHLLGLQNKPRLRTLLAEMIKHEFGEGADGRVQEFEAQMAEVNRKIRNLVDAIAQGGISSAINQALADLEAQKAAIQESLDQARQQKHRKEGAETLANRIWEYIADFDARWKRTIDPDERKDFLRSFVHQVTVNRQPTLSATVWLYRVPMLKTQQTLVKESLFEAISTRVNCGGRI